MPDSPPPAPLRADAARNEAKVLAAAREVFAEQGEHALIEDIAARAGVGVGTVYRRFGNKKGLVLAVLAASLGEVRRATTEVELGEDALEALVTVFGLLLSHGQKDRHLIMMVAPRPEKHPAQEDAHEILHGVVRRLLLRAQRDGQVRPDVSLTDVLSLLRGLMLGVFANPEPDGWRGGLDILVRGIRQSP